MTGCAKQGHGPGDSCADCLHEEVAQLRESLSRLNRRCQEAESAARIKVEEVIRAGPSLGRALSAWAAGDYKRRLDAALLQNDGLRVRLDLLCAAVEQYVSTVGPEQIGTEAVKVWRESLAEARKAWMEEARVS